MDAHPALALFTPEQIRRRFSELLEGSPFLRDTSAREPATPPSRSDGFRALEDGEISALEHNGNRCTDWGRIRARSDFDPAHVHGCVFGGHCTLGRFGYADDEELLPPGLYFSTIVDCHVDDDVRIHRCPEVQGYVIERGATIVGSTLTMSSSATFGNGVELSPGIETGGRSMRLFADIDYELAVVLTSRPMNPDVREAYAEFLEKYLEACTSSFGHVCAHARVSTTAALQDSWIGPGAVIESANSIRNSTILSSQEERTAIGDGALVADSIVQWGARIDTGAICLSSLVLEHAGVERHGKVAESVICANSTVAEGEVTASFVGPFVGFHHQALLIAAYWPRGRGNVGYGANVGSNHTSRVPDQEIRPGEGTFFGLACSIKFPANFDAAPYSIIATGITTLPQRLEFPFSLITEPAERPPGVSPAFPRIIPAWTLSHNLYALMRNRHKFETRNRARRTRFDQSIFRADITRLMATAAERLESCSGKEFYLPEDLPGLGKNFLLESDRAKAIESYRFFLRYAELTEQRNRLGEEAAGAPLSAEGIPLSAADRSALEELLHAVDAIEQMVIDSRTRDHERGKRIMDDYAETHPSLEDDQFIMVVRSSLTEEREAIARLLDRSGPE